jgi:hypothetical protein
MAALVCGRCLSIAVLLAFIASTSWAGRWPCALSHRACALCQTKVSARSVSSPVASAAIGAPTSLLSVLSFWLAMAPPTVLTAA